MATHVSTASDSVPTKTDAAATSIPGNSVNPAPVPSGAISAMGTAADPEVPVEKLADPAETPAANAVNRPFPFTSEATPIVVLRPLLSSIGHTATEGGLVAATTPASGGAGLGMRRTAMARAATTKAKRALVIAAPSPTRSGQERSTASRPPDKGPGPGNRLRRTRPCLDLQRQSRTSLGARVRAAPTHGSNSP